jgi:hypothetical protein
VTGSTCPLSAHWVLWTGRSHEHLSGGSYPDCHCDHAHMRTAVRASRLIPIILLGACKFMQRRGENGPGAIRALRDVSGVILPFRQPGNRRERVWSMGDLLSRNCAPSPEAGKTSESEGYPSPDPILWH